MKKLWFLVLLWGASAACAQTTTYVGTIKDLANNPATSGRVTWTTNAPSGGAIPGTGFFVGTTVSCTINASGVPKYSVDGTSACVIANNSSLTPTGTSYTLCFQPNYVTPGSCIVTFAIGGTVDISTLVPTPATQPSYGVASTANANTWTQPQTFQGGIGSPLPLGTSVYFADGAVPASVKAFGAKCDGSTDDTTAIQAGITWIAANHGNLTLPAGTCNISGSLIIPFAQQFRISGQSKVGTIINMTASNLPIFIANQANTHSVELDHLYLQYSSHQSTSNTQAYCLQWTNAASDSSGFYRWNVHDLQCDGSYIGLGIYTTGGNTETVWGSTFSNVTITNTSQSALSFVPSVPIGMPINVFNQLGIFDTGGGAPVPAGPAIFLSAMEAVFNGLDVEGWKNEAIWSTGGGFVNVSGCHVEHETLATSGRFFYMANGPIFIEGCDLSMDGNPALTGAQVIGEGSGATITLKNITMFVSPSGGSTFYWTTGNIANSLIFSNLVDATPGMTSMTGVVPLTAFALWPDQYPLLRQNQSTPQLEQITGPTSNTAGYTVDLGIGYYSPGKVFYTGTGSGTWATNWLYLDSSQTWHFQKCAGVSGATPPTTSPTGCSDELTVNNLGTVNGINGFQYNSGAAANHFLRATGGVFVDGAIQAADLPSTVYYCGTTTTCANTVQGSFKITTFGPLALSGGTATLTGISPAFTSTSTFVCSGNDNTAAAALKIVNASSSSITLTGTGTDTVSGICIGN